MMKKESKRDAMSKALEANMPPAPVDQQKIAAIDALTDKIVDDTEEDYEYSRKTLKELIEQSGSALESLNDLASQAEHPRAFEVLAGMFTTRADLVDRLLTLQKKRKELVVERTKGETTAVNGNNNTTTNNNQTIFVGSTTELQEFLKKQREEAGEVIDIS